VKPFDSLTKIGRARRLRRIALKALDAYALDVSSIRMINNEANCTFRIDTTDGNAYALRVNLPNMRSAAEICSELVWQEALWSDTDIAVPRPIRTRDVGLVVEASAPGVPEPRLCNLSSWVYGRTLSRSKSEAIFAKLGSLAAQLHQHGAAFQPSEAFSVPTLDTVIPHGRPDVLFEGGEINKLPAGARSLILEMRSALDAELARIFAPGQPRQIIHGDLHWWNVLVYRGTLQPIDFEDCVWAAPIQDIAITFYYVLWDERFRAYLDAFRQGYERIQPWPEAYAGQFELMMGQRALDLLNLLLSSPYANERELIPEFVDIIDRTYRPHFEHWRSLHD
jgi:Ser/Thr protein kinase RdoA (MazF antagonist)